MKTIKKTHQAYLASETSVEDLVKGYLSRIAKSQHNAYLTVCEESALAAAKYSDDILKAQGIPEHQPLFGIPIAVKDNIVTQGIRTTCASRILDNYLPPYTATAVKKLEEAGAIILGKLNMDEFGMGGSNENSAYGPVKHPTHPTRVPGGSSGGSAVAVAADLSAAALGSDTGGSVRLPASYCGVVGFKPSYGAISRYGLIAYASSLDQIGILAQNVEDTVSLYQAMAGQDSLDSTSVKIPPMTLNFSKKWRLGIPKEYFIDGVSSEVRAAITASCTRLQKMGAEIIEISLPHTSLAIAAYYIIAMCEASSNLARFDGIRYGIQPRTSDLNSYYQEVRSHFGSEVKRRILLGTFALSSGYYEAYYQKACQIRRLIQQDFLTAFKSVDAIVSPVSPTTAYQLGEKTTDPLQMYLNDIFTVPVNLAGLPAMSLPIGKDPNGLPIGLQIIGQPFKENALLALAKNIELLHETS